MNLVAYLEIWMSSSVCSEGKRRFYPKDLDVMEVTTITGHKDLRIMHKYTHLKAED